MKHILWIFSFVVLCVFTCMAATLVDVNKTGSSPEQEYFHSGDFVRYQYQLESDGAYYSLDWADSVVWDICTYAVPAQTWQSTLGTIDDAENGYLTVSLSSTESVIPQGQYKGYVKAVKLDDGGNIATQRVVVSQSIYVRYGPADVDPALVANGYYLRRPEFASVTNELWGAIAGFDPEMTNTISINGVQKRLAENPVFTITPQGIGAATLDDIPSLDGLATTVDLQGYTPLDRFAGATNDLWGSVDTATETATAASITASSALQATMLADEEIRALKAADSNFVQTVILNGESFDSVGGIVDLGTIEAGTDVTELLGEYWRKDEVVSPAVDQTARGEVADLALQLGSNITSVLDVIVAVTGAVESVMTDLELHIEDTTNPHHVTAAQVGAWAIGDVVTGAQDADARESISMVEGRVDEIENNVSDLPEIRHDIDILNQEISSLADSASAELERVSDGMAAHFADANNPYKVTAEQVGAWGKGESVTNAVDEAAREFSFLTGSKWKTLSPNPGIDSGYYMTDESHARFLLKSGMDAYGIVGGIANDPIHGLALFDATYPYPNNDDYEIINYVLLRDISTSAVERLTLNGDTYLPVDGVVDLGDIGGAEGGTVDEEARADIDKLRQSIKDSSAVGTEGLVYTLNEDNAEDLYYVVTDYVGTNNTVVIPAFHEGIPVRRLGISAKAGMASLVETLHSFAPEIEFNIVRPGGWEHPDYIDSVFHGNVRLSSVYLYTTKSLGHHPYISAKGDENPNKFERGMFQTCTSLSQVYAPELRQVGARVFAYLSMNLTIHSPNLEMAGYEAFAGVRFDNWQNVNAISSVVSQLYLYNMSEVWQTPNHYVEKSQPSIDDSRAKNAFRRLGSCPFNPSEHCIALPHLPDGACRRK